MMMMMMMTLNGILKISVFQPLCVLCIHPDRHSVKAGKFMYQPPTHIHVKIPESHKYNTGSK